MKAVQTSSRAAAAIVQTGSQTVYDATVSAALAIRRRKASRGSRSGALASAMVERELPEAALAVHESLAHGDRCSRKLEPVAQAALLRERHPAREAREPRLGVQFLGKALPLEPELGGGEPCEELREQDLAARRRFPGDVPRRVARLVG